MLEPRYSICLSTWNGERDRVRLLPALEHADALARRSAQIRGQRAGSRER